MAIEPQHAATWARSWLRCALLGVLVSVAYMANLTKVLTVASHAFPRQHMSCQVIVCLCVLQPRRLIHD